MGGERMGEVLCAYTAEAHFPPAFHAPIHTRVTYSHCGTEQALNGGLGAVLRRTEGGNAGKRRRQIRHAGDPSSPHTAPHRRAPESVDPRRVRRAPSRGQRRRSVQICAARTRIHSAKRSRAHLVRRLHPTSADKDTPARVATESRGPCLAASPLRLSAPLRAAVAVS